MGKFIDLTGQKFGRLTVIERAETYVSESGKSKAIMWKCKCECGKYVNVRGSGLKNGRAQSCGCLQKEKISKFNLIDLTGQKFGKLTVTRRAECDNSRCVKWFCDCDCGNSDVVCRSDSLRYGRKTSCGCVKKKRAVIKPKKKNKHTINGDICVVEASNGGSFIIDADKVSVLDDYLWHIDPAYGYVCSTTTRHTVRLHRIITNCPDDMMVDHINHDILDNRMCNLRICTNRENIRNRGAQKNNKSTGVKGVWPNGKNGYMARIKTKDEPLYLGTFPTIKQASDAYDEAAIKYFGEFACLNNYQGID